MNVVLEGAVIGFGVVGALVAGKAAQTLVERSGGTQCEALAAGCVGAGLAVAVLPATAVAGAAIVVTKSIDAFKHRDQLVANARAQFADAKRVVSEQYASVETKVRKPKGAVAA